MSDMLSAFFYGYMATQIIGGWVGDRYGYKRTLLVAMAVIVVATLASPVAAR